MTTLFLLKYIGGYLEVVLSGYAPERFLNLCGNHNILIWNLRKEEDVYHFFISIRAFWSIRPFVSKTGCRIRILRKIGFPFWMNRYRKRKCFLMGVILAAGLVWFLSRFIWNVEVDGNSSVTTETVLTFLDEEDCGYGDRIRTVRTGSAGTVSGNHLGIGTDLRNENDGINQGKSGTAGSNGRIAV